MQTQCLRQKKETQVRKHLEVAQSCCCAREMSQPRWFGLLIKMPPGCLLEPTGDLLTHLIRAHLEISCDDLEDAAGKHVWSSSLSTVPPWPDLDEKGEWTDRCLWFSTWGLWVLSPTSTSTQPYPVFMTILRCKNWTYKINAVHIFWKMVHRPIFRSFFGCCSAEITQRLWKEKSLKFSLTFGAIKLNQDL